MAGGAGAGSIKKEEVTDISNGKAENKEEQ